jgi:sulfatase modifying factor 1
VSGRLTEDTGIQGTANVIAMAGMSRARASVVRRSGREVKTMRSMSFCILAVLAASCGGDGDGNAAGGGSGGSAGYLPDGSGAAGAEAAAGYGGSSGNGGSAGNDGASGSTIDAGGTDSTLDGGGTEASCGVASGPGTSNSCQADGGVACGSSGTDDCCRNSVVPCGTFSRAHDPVLAATLSDFRLDIYEITVGRFRAFVASGHGTQADPPQDGSGANPHIGPSSGWQSAWNASLATDAPALMTGLKCDATHATWTDTAGSNETLPMSCITWYEAYAFCIWDGGRLPTQTEWEYAAAGGSEERLMPWGSDTANIGASYAIYDATAAAPVGMRPKGNGKWGQADLGGNVWEWTLDYWSWPRTPPCNDCANLTGTTRVIQGGSYLSTQYQELTTASATTLAPELRKYSVGARCAR